MLDLYEDYGTQKEREDAVMLEQAEIQVERALLAVDTASSMKKLAMRDAECKLVLESGNVTDLVDYYEEAAEETNTKEKGLIQRAWEAILNLIRTIKEKLFGAFRKKAEPDEVVEVDASFLEKHKKLGACVDGIKKFFSNPVGKIVGVIFGVAGVVGAFLAIKAVGKKTKMKGSQVNKIVDEDQQALDTIESGIKGFFKKAKDKEGQGPIGKVISAIKEHITEAYRAIRANHTAKKNQKKTAGMTSEDYQKQANSASATAAQKQAAADMLRAHEQGYTMDESVDEDIYEDAGDLSDIANLLATLY